MKKLLATVLSATMAFSLCAPFAACAAEADPYADLDPVTFSCVTIFDSTSSMAKALNFMAEKLAEETGGKLTMEIYDSGQTGGENEQTEALSIGEVEMAANGTLAVVNYAPEYGFFDAPFVFADGEHFMAVWNSDLGQGLRDKMEENGFHNLGIMERGYRHITTNKPIYSIDDMKGLVLRTPQSASFTETFGSLGCVCVPIALTELFTALQTGVAEASEGPWDQIVTNKLYEVQDYIVESTYYYCTSMWFMNSDFYNGLPEAYRTLIDEVSAEALDMGTDLIRSSGEELKQVCIDNGCEILEMGDLTPYLEAVKPAMDKFFAETWTVTTADEIAGFRN